MATRLQVGNTRRGSSGSLIWIILLIIIIAGIGGVYYFYNNLKNSTELKADSISYLISYEDGKNTEIYFVRIKNNSRKIFIVKSPDNVYYSEKNLYIDSLKPEEALTNFEEIFEINPSTIKYYFSVKKDTVPSLVAKLKGSGTTIDNFFDTLKTRKSGLMDMFTINKLIDIIRKDGSTNISYNGMFALLQAFSKYSITGYDKLEIKTLLSQPIEINLPDLKKDVKRNYIDKTNIESLKTIME
ncbi:hypothetical protein XO10_02565 [Marinitoga sp. 1135]|uniref:hypothetical protein n=1 Tax=unclassified Marinitoga TaxID=2640159 RepID=UPI00095095CE|nr:MULTISPECIES: hypothetical protein [unclassified Marinitoga]APT75449.1 hypothetical protein LN42_02875 [Marinitoga sp. 1137]NUU95175.1 hypothetical protein [Marinitoga sp. 1135]NUU97107.1 hypothetical protein [Marinitoga sp. 1138]